jgi:cell wall-associated NlpC family hydrolase
MQRRLAWTLTILLATALCALALPASSLAGPSIASARVQASRLESQIGALNTRMEMVVERYDAAAQKRAGLTASIAANGSQLTSTRYQLALAQQQLAEQVVAMYKAPTTDYLNVMLATRSFSELTSQLTMFDKTGQQSALTVTQIDALKAAVEQRRQTLVAQRAQVQRVVAQIARQKTQIIASLQQRQHLLQGAQGQVRRLLQQQQQAQAAAASRAAKAALAADRHAAAAVVAPQPARPNSGSGGAPPARTTAPQHHHARPHSGSGGAPHGGGDMPSAITIAARYLGVPYVWGGASPAGFDCSGLVMYVFAQLGISLPHNAAMQFTCCTPVPRADLQPGDLVFYGSSAATIYHVGIYVGNDTMIDAPCTGEDVQYDTLFSGFYSGGRVN